MVGPGVIEDSSDSDRWGFIKEGAVVFYKGGYILGGYVFLQVDADSIIAYED